MKEMGFLVACLLLGTNSVSAQTQMSSKDIFQTQRSAVVQIYVNDIFRGPGFLPSDDGLIVTANHFVTTRDSQFKDWATDKWYARGDSNTRPSDS